MHVFVKYYLVLKKNKMSQYNKYNSDSNPDEVNLMPLLRYIKRKLDSFGRWVSYIYFIIVRYFLLIAKFLGVGIIIGAVYYFTATPIYKSTAIVASHLLNNDYSESLVNELRWLTREKNQEELSSLLKLDKSVTEKIKKIEYESFAKNPLDSIVNTAFKIHIYVKDNTILDTLETSLINYLENNSYAIKRKNVKMNALKDYSSVMNSEIMELDSIKRILSLRGGFTSTTLESYEQILSMYNRKLVVLEQLALLRNYEIIQGFTFFRKPYSPRLRHPFIIAIVFGFIGFIAAYRKDKANNTKQ
jgi:hypothetical protein